MKTESNCSWRQNIGGQLVLRREYTSDVFRGRQNIWEQELQLWNRD